MGQESKPNQPRKLKLEDFDHWHCVKIRVRYKDTDRMGVVYYGNYLTYFEVARSEFMRAVGFSYSRLEKEGYTLVVVEACAKYHANVGYDDLLYVYTAITEIRKARVKFLYRVVDETGRLIVTGHTEHACLGLNKKPSKIPNKIRLVLEREKTSS